MKRILLLVDASYQSHRAAAAYPHLTSADNTFTGGLYGFLAMLAKQIRLTEATDVLITLDRKPYRRSLLYPDYKLLRKSSGNDELKEKQKIALPQILEACGVIGLPTLGVDGFESDDVIGHIVARRRGRYKAIYAASNDSDLYQLFYCPWFKVFRTDLTDLVDYWGLKKLHGLEPDEFMLASAIMGTHNDVAGIRGVGIKTAVKAAKDLALQRKYREQYGALIERNLRLIKLPYEGFPADLRLPPRGTFDRIALYRWASRYDINITGAMVDAFEQVCD